MPRSTPNGCVNGGEIMKAAPATFTDHTATDPWIPEKRSDLGSLFR